MCSTVSDTLDKRGKSENEIDLSIARGLLAPQTPIKDGGATTISSKVSGTVKIQPIDTKIRLRLMNTQVRFSMGSECADDI